MTPFLPYVGRQEKIVHVGVVFGKGSVEHESRRSISILFLGCKCFSNAMADQLENYGATVNEDCR